MRILTLIFLLAVAWTLPAQAKGDDPAELARTFDAAWVFLPDEGPTGYRRVTVATLEKVLTETAQEAPWPVVVYAHGCSGHWRATQETGRALARAGFLVVAPDSFARLDKPVSCTTNPIRGGLHRAVLGWRQAEMAHAIDRVRALPGLDRDAVFLMGHSEGGITAATFTGRPLAGRVVEGWTCHAGWPEYKGLAAPAGEPVLSLVGEDDPWFRLPILSGDCGAFMTERPESRSLVLRAPSPLAKAHWLSEDPAIQAEIVAFLESHRP
ncbi:MAG: hypothetical protein Kilf2KO_22770 [Rhodospirillales bacterium]